MSASRRPAHEAPAVLPRGSSRRGAPRLYLRTGVLLRDPRGRAQAGVLGNLGDGGIFVHAPAPFPSGSRLRVAIDLGAAGEGGTLEAEGRVAWVRRQGDRRLPGYGVRFTDIDPADRNRIRDLLDRRAAATRRLWMD
jgi:uncharacterized protein (TIGR02266 family)